MLAGTNHDLQYVTHASIFEVSVLIGKIPMNTKLDSLLIDTKGMQHSADKYSSIILAGVRLQTVYATIKTRVYVYMEKILRNNNKKVD